jgi:TRAP-type C4-dicarboxylate transport system substrate-binding protein
MKYRMSEPILFGLGGLVIVRNVWEKLTLEDREVFLSVNEKWSEVHKQKTLKDNERALQLLDNQGVEVITPPPSDLTEWREVSQRTWDRLAGRVYSEELLAEILQHRDEFQATSAP